MLLSHFAVFHFMSCLDTSEWKAFLIIPTVCYILMIDVTIKKSKLIVITTLTAFFLYLHSFSSSKEILKALRNNFDLPLSDAVGISL